MIIVKNKKRPVDFYIFETRLEAVTWIENLPKKYGKDYEIAKTRKSPFKVLEAR